jgi:hypothetical protein
MILSVYVGKEARGRTLGCKLRVLVRSKNLLLRISCEHMFVLDYRVSVLG